MGAQKKNREVRCWERAGYAVLIPRVPLQRKTPGKPRGQNEPERRVTGRLVGQRTGSQRVYVEFPSVCGIRLRLQQFFFCFFVNPSLDILLRLWNFWAA